MHLQTSYVRTSKKKIRMPRSRNRIGNGALAECLARYIHPSQPIRAKYINDYDTARIGGLTLVGKDEMTIKKRKVQCALMIHPDFPNETLYAAVKKVKVTAEGPPQDFWDAAPPEVQEEKEPENQDEAGENPRQAEIAAAGLEAPYAVGALREEGIEVDDDNEPAPENIPNENEAASDGIFSNEWGFEGIDFRRR